MTYIRKTQDEYQIWQRLPTGEFFEVCSYDVLSEAQVDLKEYRFSDPSSSFCVRKFRIPLQEAV